MARVLGILGNARKDGYTIRVLREALRAASEKPNVETELIHLLEYKFGPCRSCYECIRNSSHRCILQDDMGEKGRLWRKIEEANGLIIASPVHLWTPDALTHLFMERLYPYVWSGELRGIPVMTIAVASNQGFHITANRILCEWAFTLGMKYVGGLPVHAAHMDKSLREARYLGKILAEEALKDEMEGRRSPTDLEHWLSYQDSPWKVYPSYIENLTMGTGDPEFSIIRYALSHETFRKKEAIELLKKADEEFRRFAHQYQMENHEDAIRHLVRASAFWTHATWKEFLEEQLIKAPPPKTYRPIEKINRTCG